MAVIRSDDLERTLIVSCGYTALAIFLIVARKYPKLGMGCWIAVLCFVPYWIGVDVKTFLPAVTLVALALVVAFGSLQSPHLGFVDWAVISLLVIFLATAVLGLATLSAGFTLLFTWGVSYLLGRMVLTWMSPGWVFRAFAVAFTLVALLAIAEFITGTNFFVQWRATNSLYGIWSPLQYRSGQLRVEGAFGHSIALGTSLAMAIPLTVATNFRRWIRASMIVCMLAAATLTFSRLGMICSVLGLLLSILFMHNDLAPRAKMFLTGGIVAVVAALLPFVNTLFESAGTEASGSAGYRADLLSLFSEMGLVGLSPSFAVSPRGEATFGGFQSIDSALILLGLTYGLIPLIIVIALLSIAVVLLVRGRATAPTVAIVAQIPALAAVALITQYAVFLCFMGGLAVACQMLRSIPVGLEMKTVTIPGVAFSRAGLDARDSFLRAGRYLPNIIRRRQASFSALGPKIRGHDHERIEDAGTR